MFCMTIVYQGTEQEKLFSNCHHFEWGTSRAGNSNENKNTNYGCVALPDTNSEKNFYTNSAKIFLLKIA